EVGVVVKRYRRIYWYAVPVRDPRDIQRDILHVGDAQVVWVGLRECGPRLVYDHVLGRETDLTQYRKVVFRERQVAHGVLRIARRVARQGAAHHEVRRVETEARDEI